MTPSEDRISHLAHSIKERLWRDDIADFSDDARALTCIKQSLSSFFSQFDEMDEAIRAKLRSKTPGSREYELLYQKFFQEEAARRKW